MLALLKCGTGIPFNRLERLQDQLGMPLPAATQWELLESAAQEFQPAWKELIRQGAMRAMPTRRGCSIAMHVKEVGSGAAERELRQKLIDVAEA
jgi:hypothetical protein